SVRSRNMAAMAKHVPGQGDVRKSTCPLQGLLERTSFLGQQELVDIDECHAVISAAKVQQRVCKGERLAFQELPALFVANAHFPRHDGQLLWSQDSLEHAQRTVGRAVVV